MSSQNYLTYQVLIPNDDLKVGQFPKTYLKDTLESYDYGAKTYEDFTKVTICETTLPILIDLLLLGLFLAEPIYLLRVKRYYTTGIRNSMV